MLSLSLSIYIYIYIYIYICIYIIIIIIIIIIFLVLENLFKQIYSEINGKGRTILRLFLYRSRDKIHRNVLEAIYIAINHIYQPLRSGRIWHKVNFLAEFNRFEFRVFLLLD